MQRFVWLMLGLVLFATPSVRAEKPGGKGTEVRVDPLAVELHGPAAVYSLLVNGKNEEGRLFDLTSDATFRSLDPDIATVNSLGCVRPVRDGQATIEVVAGGQVQRVVVAVRDSAQPRRFNFENDIVPILSRFGCNSSGCHGKAEGQNGFKLSVFGFDPLGDYVALTKEARGRRVFLASPEHSLLLRKVCGAVAHGGGLRIPRRSSEYETLRAWIAAGIPYGAETDPKVSAIRVEPSERQLAMKALQRLRVVARYSDGREADVTGHAKFQSNNEGLASVSADGVMAAGEAPGEAAVMASYMGAVAVFRAIIPRGERIADYPELPENNFIDAHVHRKLRKLNIFPSELVDDADYLRRVYLDVIGTLPTPAEARRFLADQRSDKRGRMVDELLERPEFADYWALKWSDLLRVDRQALGHKNAYAYYQWIRESFAVNKPFDRFVRELLAAEGPVQEVGAANFYKVAGKPGDTASTLSQIFLGVRIACAQCHHHPFDRWSQTDYYGMQAFFTQVGTMVTSKREMLMTAKDELTKHPRTGETIFAHALAATMPKASPAGDRRQVLADWITAPDNPWFARNLANRVWAHFLGRGLVEPVDDVRATNPPTNPELLDALARYVVENKFDFRQLVRVITASRAYQRSSRPNETNEKDEQNYSRALFKRIQAEVLFDMVCQTTGVAEKFSGVPSGVRASQLWDSKVPHYFLKLFGRPVRVTACECERVAEPNVSQVLHILNSPEIHDKLVHEGGNVAHWVRSIPEDDQLVDEIYLTFYSRFPTSKEREVAVDFLRKQQGKRRQAAEDLAWTMMNTLEFVFNH